MIYDLDITLTRCGPNVKVQAYIALMGLVTRTAPFCDVNLLQ